MVLSDPLSLSPRTDPQDVGDLQVLEEREVDVFRLHDCDLRGVGGWGKECLRHAGRLMLPRSLRSLGSIPPFLPARHD